MTAYQKLQWLLLSRVAEFHQVSPPAYDAEIVEKMFDELQENDYDTFCDAKIEVRGGELGTGLPAPRSRYYESTSVAAKLPDGTYIGWTYWYGGGKHAEPESIDWMDAVYDVECTEVVEVVKKFSKKGRS